ncbi:hypothetical protein CWI39_0171p0010 [Hamiltosporidium magnivora]|uniref:Uncharacterized protein n=1 Tax=Hamiltosporidium magnivora TaxID=148818 RepID=A0A4Q9LM09_9MICR|nr:hypothetical protein CWI39_0171p0010 [Hamiltosporidium magnivora]
MFFHIFICLAASSQEINLCSILLDLTMDENMHLELSYSIMADETELEELPKLQVFFSIKIKQHTSEEFHEFLTHFTTLVVVIVYNSYIERNFKEYRPELLFNLICFGKFNIKKIVENIFGNFLVNEISRLCVKSYEELKTSNIALYTAISNSFNLIDKTDLVVLENSVILLANRGNASFISRKPIIENVLINQNEFGEIFAFSRDKTTFQNSLGDGDDPRVSIETLCRKSDVNNCNTLYEFLKEKTKEEYHKYIYIIISLKILSLEEATLNGCNISKIIIEFLFLVDVARKGAWNG